MDNKQINTVGNKSLADANVKLTFFQKTPFFAATFGGFAWPIFMAFLTMFWTDVARIPVAVTTVFLFVTKFWDAVNDPLIGYFADRTQTRWGRYRPWLLSFIPTSILGLLTFTVLPGAGTTAQSVFSLSMYFLFTLFMTMSDVPSQALVAATTTDPATRGSIHGFRMAGAYGTNILTGAFFMPLVLFFSAQKPTEGPPFNGHGFFMAMLIFTIVGLPFGFYYFFGTKERVTIPVSKHKLSESFKTLKGNKPFWLFFWAFFIYGISSGTTTARSFYWQYLYGDVGGIAFNITIWMIGMVIGALAAGYLCKRVPNKAYLVTAFWLFGGILTAVLSFMKLTPGCDTTPFHVVTAIMGIGVGGGTTAMYAILPDITELTQQISGKRVAGFVSSLLNMSYQISLAFGAAGFTLVLAILGYQPSDVGGQPESVLSTINVFSYTIPAFCYAIPGLMMLKYKIDNKAFAKIRDELAAMDLDDGSAPAEAPTSDDAE